MKLSQAATEYIVLMGQMFMARHNGLDETEILDKMDTAWWKLTAEEIDVMNAVSKAIGPIMRESHD